MSEIEVIAPNILDISDKIDERCKDVKVFKDTDGSIKANFKGDLFEYQTKMLKNGNRTVIYYFAPIVSDVVKVDRVIEFRLSTQSVSYDGFNDTKFVRTEEEKRIQRDIRLRNYYLNVKKPRRQKERSQKDYTRACAYCGTLFTPKHSQEKFCKDTCRETYQKQKARESQQANRERYNEYQREYRAKNKEKFREYSKKYYNSEKGKEVVQARLQARRQQGKP